MLKRIIIVTDKETNTDSAYSSVKKLAPDFKMDITQSDKVIRALNSKEGGYIYDTIYLTIKRMRINDKQETI